MFTKKKKKPQISLPSNFEHRVHTGFDKREGRYVGLPLQWASIVGNNQILKSSNRPLPLVDPSEITPTEILDLKTIVRPHFNNNKPFDDVSMISHASGQHPLQIPPATNGIVLPKTSNVARSNSLRSSSPPRIRRDLRGNANVPPSVPEEPSVPGGSINQYPSIRRDGTLGGGPIAGGVVPPPANYATKPQPQQAMHAHLQQPDWSRAPPPAGGPGAPLPHGQYPNDNQALYQTNGMAAQNQKGLNGNGHPNAISVHTDLPAPYFR